MNSKTILFLLMFLAVAATAADLSESIDKFKPSEQATANPAGANKDDKGDPTKGEIGIIATLAGIYNKGREAVKSVYDEIQYWKGIGATYGMMKDWYREQKEKYKQIQRTVGKLANNPREVFQNRKGKDWFDDVLGFLDASFSYVNHFTGTAAEVFDKTDILAYGSMRELNMVFSHAEKYVTLVGNSKISGILMPNTDEIYNKFDEIIYTSNMSDEYKQRIMNRENYKRLSSDSAAYTLTPEQQAQIDTFISNSNSFLAAAGTENYPETRIVNLMKGLTASATGNSAMYYEWAVGSMDRLSQRMTEIDTLFKKDELNNIMDLQLLAAKLELEMINANNKRILHELEALKVHHAMLAYEIWKHDRKKVFDESMIADVLTLEQTMADNLEIYLELHPEKLEKLGL
jgi:hypothetical protein